MCDVTNSIFARNFASAGGGAVYFEDQVVDVLNCTFADNGADERGGAVHLERVNASIINSIFTGSPAHAIYELTEDADPVMDSNLFFNNPDGNYYDFDGAIVNSIAALNNLPNSDRNIAGDPVFVDPANDNYRIAFDSAARGGASLVFAPLVDFEGDARPGPGGTADSGADEVTDTTPPNVVALSTEAPALTNSDELTYLLEFDEVVDGVTTDDIGVLTTGLSDVQVTAVAPLTKAARIWEVTVDTGTGDGTLRLSVVDDDSIRDLAGVALGGTGAGNGNFTSEAIITIDRTPPVITVDEPDPRTVEAGTPVLEFNVTATDNTDGDLTDQITMVSLPELNLAVPGTYGVVFSVSDSAGNLTATFPLTVNVVDSIPPLIALLGDNPMTLDVGDTYVEPGYLAFDLISGNHQDDVVVTGSVDTSAPGETTLSYEVSDMAGNVAMTTRTVIVRDSVPPVITLLGGNPLDVALDAAFTDPGAMASDNFDGDITADITVEGTVDTSVAGTYALSYSVADSSGNAVTLVRLVNVLTPSDFALLPAEQQVTAAGGTVTFNVINTGDSAQSWAATITSGAEWATITVGTSGTDAGVITVSYQENTAQAERSATIQIESTTKAALPLEATLVQAPAPKAGLFGCGPATGAPKNFLGDALCMLLLALALAATAARGRVRPENR